MRRGMAWTGMLSAVLAAGLVAPALAQRAEREGAGPASEGREVIGPIEPDVDRPFRGSDWRRGSLHITSPGGDWAAAMRLGRWLRAHGHRVTAGILPRESETSGIRPGGLICYDACMLVVLGSREATAVWGADLRLRLPSDLALRREVLRYLAEVGVPGGLAGRLSASPDGISGAALWVQAGRLSVLEPARPVEEPLAAFTEHADGPASWLRLEGPGQGEAAVFSCGVGASLVLSLRFRRGWEWLPLEVLEEAFPIVLEGPWPGAEILLPWISLDRDRGRLVGQIWLGGAALQALTAQESLGRRAEIGVSREAGRNAQAELPRILVDGEGRAGIRHLVARCAS